MSQPEVLALIFEPLDANRLSTDVAVKILKGIKQLSMDHNTLANLHQAGTIRRLVRVLARHDGPMKTVTPPPIFLFSFFPVSGIFFPLFFSPLPLSHFYLPIF